MEERTGRAELKKLEGLYKDSSVSEKKKKKGNKQTQKNENKQANKTKQKIM